MTLILGYKNMINRKEFIEKYFTPSGSGYLKVVFPDDPPGYNPIPIYVNANPAYWGDREWKLADHSIDLINEKYRADHPAWIERFADQLKINPCSWAQQTFLIKRSLITEDAPTIPTCAAPLSDLFVIAIKRHFEVTDEIVFAVKYGYDRNFGDIIPCLNFTHIERIIFDEKERRK